MDIKDINGNSIIIIDQERVLNTIADATIEVFGEKYADRIRNTIKNTDILVAPKVKGLYDWSGMDYGYDAKEEVFGKFYKVFIRELGIEEKKRDTLLRNIVHLLVTDDKAFKDLKVITECKDLDYISGDLVANYLSSYILDEGAIGYDEKGVQSLKKIADIIDQEWYGKYKLDYLKVSNDDANMAKYVKFQMETCIEDQHVVRVIGEADVNEFVISQINKVFGEKQEKLPIYEAEVNFILSQLGRDPKDLKDPKKVTNYEKAQYISLFAKYAKDFNYYTYESVIRRKEFRQLFLSRNLRTQYWQILSSNLYNKLFNEPLFMDAIENMQNILKRNNSYIGIYPCADVIYPFMFSPTATLAFATYYIDKQKNLKHIIVVPSAQDMVDETVIHEALHTFQTSVLAVVDKEINGAKCKDVVTKCGAMIENQTHLPGDPDEFDLEAFALYQCYTGTATTNSINLNKVNNKYETRMITEVLNEYLTMKVGDVLRKQGIKLLDCSREKSNIVVTYRDMFENMHDFLENNLTTLIDCSMSDDIEAFEKAFGRKEWRKILRHVNQYFDATKSCEDYDELELSGKSSYEITKTK